jgi:hypothetical protein
MWPLGLVLVILVSFGRPNCDGIGPPGNFATCAYMTFFPISFKIHNSILFNYFIYCTKEHFLCVFFNINIQTHIVQSFTLIKSTGV